MASQQIKKVHWLIIVGLLSVAVGCVMAVLLFLLLTFPASVQPGPLPSTPSEAVLPATPSPTETRGLFPVPTVQFVALEPITGYANCESYGIYGTIISEQGEPLPLVQVTLWQHPDGGLLAIDSTGDDGQYRLTLPGKPAHSDVRVQLYRRDRPISEPVLLKIYFDCQNGFQIYQVDWQKKGQ